MLISIRYVIAVLFMPAVVFCGLLPEVKSFREFLELLRVTATSAIWVPLLILVPLLPEPKQRAIGDAYSNALEDLR